MEQGTSARQTIDVTGLPEEAVRAVESLVTLLRDRMPPAGGPAPFPSRDEWVRAIRAWAASHPPRASADWGREGIYAGRGE